MLVHHRLTQCNNEHPSQSYLGDKNYGISKRDKTYQNYAPLDILKLTKPTPFMEDHKRKREIKLKKITQNTLSDLIKLSLS